MTKAMVRDHDLLTGEIVDREMTDKELSQLQADIAEKTKREADQADKDAAKQAVLDKLGLSVDEVAALLG